MSSSFIRFATNKLVQVLIPMMLLLAALVICASSLGPSAAIKKHDEYYAELEATKTVISEVINMPTSGIEVFFEGENAKDAALYYRANGHATSFSDGEAAKHMRKAIELYPYRELDTKAMSKSCTIRLVVSVFIVALAITLFLTLRRLEKSVA